MKMMMKIGVLMGLSSVASVAAAPSKVIRRGHEINVKSRIGQNLMSNARSLENKNEVNFDFIGGYSIKFQGCHHVTQWNPNADDEDDVRIKTKRLVRFRLCPSESCSNSRSAGCSSKYGDYVVDLNTFVASYMEAAMEDKDQICYDTKEECSQECSGGDDDDCMESCYESFGVEYCLNYDGNNNNNNNDDDFDPLDFAECAQWENNRRRLEDANNNNNNNNNEYYIGPYCADQGGEIHLGLFMEETCTTFANNGESVFYNAMGYSMPFSESSLVSTRCMSCTADDGDGNYEVRDVCQNVYQVAGKCETKMNVDYPNESACTYIEGIKIIREDGVIRTSAVKKSKAAAVCIGLFLTIAVLLAGYVYYLRTKLGRAKINLTAASQSTLT